jgi:ferric-dicitrate binding protein FerR (iron transport regulator)
MTERINNQNSESESLKKLDLEQKIMKHTARMKVPQGLSKEEALLKVKSRISSGNTEFQVKRNLKRSLYLYSSIAASLLLLIGIFRIWIYNPVTKVIVAKADHTEYNLPDGSHVNINSDSRISFNMKDFIRNRRLKLDGEAYFEIAKGDNFIISTKHADIKILGTTFNVFSRGDEFKVSCLTGKILVFDKNTSVTIVPGETATIKDNKLTYFQDKNISTANSWTAGEFYFENAPLNLIFNELERQFNVKFDLQNVGEKYFTGSFSNISLNTALEIICQPMGLKYEIGGKNKIFISEKKP